MDPITRNMRAATAAALNKTADQVKNEAVREIARRYRVDTRGTRIGVKKNIFVAYRASVRSLRVVIKAIDKRLGIAKFPHEQMRTGVRVNVKGQNRKILRGTFIATMESGHTGVFKRYGRKVMPTKGRYEALSIERQKIREIFTVSTASMFAQRDVSRHLLGHAADVFPRVLQNQIDWRTK